MMHSGDEDDKLWTVDRFGSIRLNQTFYKKKKKSSSAVRRDELVFNSVRFGKRNIF